MRYLGDGREVVRPDASCVYAGTAPAPLRRWQCRVLCDRFAANGRSTHSARGAVLWVIVEFCRHNHIDIDVTVHGRAGFTVRARDYAPLVMGAAR